MYFGKAKHLQTLFNQPFVNYRIKNETEEIIQQKAYQSKVIN